MSVSSPSSLTPLKQQRFQELMRRGKELVQDGDVRGGLESMKLAAAICTTTKLLSRIKKCEEYLQAESEDEEESTTSVAKGFNLRREVYLKLYAYQREGIAWMWKLFQKEKGGVLGDDMGLGKTIQVIGFLSGMFDAQLIKHVLIVMPVSLLANWKNEFYQWCPAITLCVFHGGTKKERERNLYRVQRRSGVLLTSYGIVSSNEESLTTMDDRSFVWDYVILDEGHKIKNPTKTTKAVHNISSRNRLILTGTPIQNNLEELWALYDFAHHGALLGSKRTFKMQYEAPILHARAKGSTIGERKLGTEIAENLRKLIEPYFLRRTKEEVLKEESNKENLEVTEIDEIEKRMENMRISPLSRKNDLILWTFLSEVQYKIYTGFLQSESVKRILMTKKSPLVQLTVLKKICDHPRLLSNKQGFELLLNDEISEDDINRVFDTEVGPTVSFDNITDEELIAESGKLVVLIPLLKNLCREGHRTLLFSQSRKILDIIQRILSNNHYKVLRIDGSILKLEERYKIVQLFQNDSSYTILLLTTQVGGVGLTLTAADRVVIYDPSWNPATDAQAVDRAYRIGQSKNVVVYRLITCGTVEEKIYRRQVFKDSIIKQATGGNKDPHRYFTHQELYELFTVDNVRYSSTQVQLAELHSNERKTDTSLDEHIAFLHSLELFGISDHDLMFTKNIQDKTEDNDENVDTTDYIQKRVQLAQHMVQVEASLAQEDIRKYGSCNRFTSSSVHSGKNSSSKGSYNSTTTVRNVPSQENANNSIELIEEIGDMHDIFLSGENKLRNKHSTEVPIIQDISFQGDEIHTSVCYKPSKFIEDFCFGENADSCVKENKEFDGKSNAFNVMENKLYSQECSESPVTKERSFKRDGINLLSENTSDRTVPDNNEDTYVDECESNQLNVVKAAANINKVTDISCSPISSKIASTKEHYEKSSRNSSVQRAHLNALDSALNRKSSRTMLVHNEKSVLFRRSRGDNSKLVESADVSAEVIVSDSDSESEMKSFAQPKIKSSFYCSPHNVSNVNPDVSFSPSLSASVVEDSFLDVEESEIASKGVRTVNRSYNFHGDVQTPKQTKCENEKLLRFVALYNSLSKDNQKCISISPVAAGNNTASKHYNELEKNCNFDTFKNNASSPVSKDSSDVLQLAKLPIQEELRKTPDSSYNWGITDNMISENVCNSSKRITPLKVTANSTGGALCESPFAKALARSVEVTVTGNMHLEQRFSTEAENAELNSSESAELNSSENAELNSSEASDVASPIAIRRNKNCRKFIKSDSEDIDSSENSKEDFSDEDSVQSSLNDFIVSDDEEEGNSSSNESSFSSDKRKKKSMLKYAYTECDEASFDSVNNESSSNENDESCESEDAEDSSETFNN